ncbi:MAG: chemotaxis protein CheW [Thermodesulfobacteriota bacterium]
MSTRQFVTFSVGGLLAGLDVRNVREINRLPEITPVPRAPAFVRGLVNLRGQTVTVFDLGACLAVGRCLLSEESRNVVLKADAVGLLVDRVGDVVRAEGGEVEPPPANAAEIDAELVEGVVQLPEDLLLILSVPRLLDPARLRAPAQPPSGARS